MGHDKCMLVLLAALALHQSVDIPAKQSVWVYTHASDPAGDEFLRIWGIDGHPVPAKPVDNMDYSFGYLKFDVGGAAAGKPKKAVLILHNVSPAPFSEADAKQSPLQARELTGTFDGTTWDYSKSSTVAPGDAASVFGQGKLAGPIGSSTALEIDIDLLQGPNDFPRALGKAKAGDHTLYLALTSAMQPSQSGSTGSGGVYKVYSAAAKDASLKPTLKLEF